MSNSRNKSHFHNWAFESIRFCCCQVEYTECFKTPFKCYPGLMLAEIVLLQLNAYYMLEESISWCWALLLQFSCFLCWCGITILNYLFGAYGENLFALNGQSICLLIFVWLFLTPSGYFDQLWYFFPIHEIKRVRNVTLNCDWSKCRKMFKRNRTSREITCKFSSNHVHSSFLPIFRV